MNLKYYVKKIGWGRELELPFSQGYAIKALIKRYKIKATAWGYFLDTIGIETKHQKMLWKDRGTHLEWIGMINKFDNNKVILASPKPKIKSDKRRISAKQHDDALNVLPPLKHNGDTFYMVEFLRGDETTKYFKEKGKYYCETVNFRDEFPNMTEEEYLEARY